MKADLKKYAAALREGAATVLRRHPVEAVLLACVTLGWILAAEFQWEEELCMPRLALGLWYALLALVVNRAAEGPWRRIYAVSWAPLVPLLLWPGLAGWIESERFILTATVLTPLLLVVARRQRDDRRFVEEGCILLRSAVLGWFFANVALGLFQAILWSTAYIFGFEEARWVARTAYDTLVVTEFFAAPMLSMMMLDRWEGVSYRSSRVTELLIGKLLTPALILYAALLTLYGTKILLTWSLPRGGVAWMVFLFMSVLFFARMLGELLDTRPAAWFYRRFGLVALPAVLLFWTGAARRIGEYGLTEWRVWLLACGAAMTFAAALLALRRKGGYLWIAAATLLLFTALVYIPALSPERAGLASQRRRFERLAREIALVDADGRLRTDRAPLADTLRWESYREAFAAMRYIMARDSAFCRELGVPHNRRWEIERLLLPGRLHDMVLFGGDTETEAADTVAEFRFFADLRLPPNQSVEAVAAYPHLRVCPATLQESEPREGVTYDGRRLRVQLDGELLLDIGADELIARQLEQTGIEPEALPDLGAEKRLRMLDYRGERVRVLFSLLSITREPDGGYWFGEIETALIWQR